MIRTYPDYYSDFKCVAGACKHTCCAGWEIDVDAVSFDRFRPHPDIMQHIRTEDDTNVITLRENGDCPFLNSDHLCDMIIRHGEDMLCDICADHPRFRNFFSDRTEIGLGMCCEAAADMILSRTDSVRFTAVEDDTEADPLYEDELYVLRVRDRILDILRDRRDPILERIDRVMTETDCFLPPMSEAEVFNILGKLEYLDDTWNDLIRLYRTPEPSVAFDPASEIMLEQVAVYYVWRHIAPACEDDDLYGRILLCVFLFRITAALIAVRNFKDHQWNIEVCRILSANIEYSDSNIQTLIEALEN